MEESKEKTVCPVCGVKGMTNFSNDKTQLDFRAYFTAKILQF